MVLAILLGSCAPAATATAPAVAPAATTDEFVCAPPAGYEPASGNKIIGTDFAQIGEQLYSIEGEFNGVDEFAFINANGQKSVFKTNNGLNEIEVDLVFLYENYRITVRGFEIVFYICDEQMFVKKEDLNLPTT
jgi:hypothetical protein